MQVRGRGRGAIVPTVSNTVQFTGTVTPNFWCAYLVAASSRAAVTHAISRRNTPSFRPCRSLSTTSKPHIQRSILRTAQSTNFLTARYPSISSRMASTLPSEAPEWSAQRVRETFLNYFTGNGHTFGKFLCCEALRTYLTHTYHSEVLTRGSFVRSDPAVHQCWHEPV